MTHARFMGGKRMQKIWSKMQLTEKYLKTFELKRGTSGISGELQMRT